MKNFNVKLLTDALKKYISPLAAVGLTVLAVGAAVILLSRLSTPFADIYNRTAGAFLRAVFNSVTYLLPVSFAEYLLLCSPVFIFLLFYYALKYASVTWVSSIRFSVTLISVIALLFGCFNLNFAPGYHTTPLAQRLGYIEKDITVGELSYTAKRLLYEANLLSAEMNYGSDDLSKMPYDTDVLSKKLNTAYERVCAEHDFIQGMKCRVKPVVLSEPWTYTHIAGVYTYFTGESNLNMNFPDYTLPFSAAHEMAHQRGIAREDEANFVAFLACISSDDPYIRYSGYISVYEYVASALYATDKDTYFSVLGAMKEDVRKELIAYGKFFEKYSDNTVADISGAVNDTYLKQNGQEAGAMSYELVVELAVAYFRL